MTHSKHTRLIDRFPANIVKRQRRAQGLTQQHGTRPKSFSGTPLIAAQLYTAEQLKQKGYDPKYFESGKSGVLY